MSWGLSPRSRWSRCRPAALERWRDGTGRPSGDPGGSARPPRGARRRAGRALGAVAGDGPVLGQLAHLVEPHKHRVGTGPGDVDRAGLRILISEGVDELRARPGQEVYDEPRAQPPGGPDPFDLEVVEPFDELVLGQAIRWGSADVVVSVTGEDSEVAADEVTAQVEDGPLGAGGGVLPLAVVDGGQ